MFKGASRVLFEWFEVLLKCFKVVSMFRVLRDAIKVFRGCFKAASKIDLGTSRCF